MAHRAGYEPHNQGELYMEDDGRTVAVTYHDMHGHNAEELAKRWNAYPEHLELLAAIRLTLAADHATHQSGNLERMLLRLQAMPELSRDASTGKLNG